MGCCKNCGCSTEDESLTPHLAINGPVVAIARFRSLAECGFFADELTAGAGVVCETRTEDEFDGLTDKWRAWYVLCVRDDDAQKAVEYLSERIAAHQAEPRDEYHDDEPTDDENTGNNQPPAETFDSQPSRSGWGVPILLSAIVTAGVVWWLFPQGTITSDVAEELGRSDQQWTQTNSNGRIVRQMKFDRTNGLLRISEDSNGDGEFERTREFEL